MKDHVICKGAKLQIEFYQRVNGEMPAREYLESLPLNVQAKLLALAAYIADEGRIYDKEKFRIVDKEERIWEFKPHQNRFFCFFVKDGILVITNGYKKEGQKVEKKYLDIAIECKKDHLARCARRK